MHQDRLFRLAYAGYALNAYYVPPEGWTLIVRARRADEAWGDTEAVTYARLTTMELLDTMAAHGETVLLG